MSSERVQKSERSRSRSPARAPRSRDRDRGGADADHNSLNYVYISNAPYDLTWMELKDMIREHAGETAFVEFLEDATGRSKGCAVVQFKDREAAEKCVTNMHRMKVKDRLIVVKEVRDPDRFFRKVYEDTGVDFLHGRSSRPRTAARDQSSLYDQNTAPILRHLDIKQQDLCNRIFVANLPFTIQTSRIKDLFSLAGKIVDMDLYLDKEGKSKGIAIIEYQNSWEAVQAISLLNNQRYHERTLVVKMDRFNRNDAVPRGPNGLPEGLRQIGQGLGDRGQICYTVSDVLASPNRDLAFARSLSPLPMGGFGSSGNGYQGMDMSMSSAAYLPNEMPSRFATDTFVNRESGMPMRQGGGNASFSSIDTLDPYASSRSAHALQVDYLQSMDRFGSSNVDRVADYSSAAGLDAFGSAGLITARGTAATGPRAMQSTAVIVRGLPFSLPWPRLKELANLGGEVDAESVDNLSLGVVRISYKSVAEADRARRFLHGYTMDGRPLQAEFE